MKVIPSYKITILISVLLHAVIFALLFCHFSNPKPKVEKNISIVKAVAISEQQLKHSAPHETQKAPAEQLVSRAEPLSENTIRKIEQVALKQPNNTPLPIAKSLSTKTSSTPVPQVIKDESPLALQEPDLNEKAELKKREEEKKREQQKKAKAEIKKKEALLARKQQEEEAKQLRQELAEETKEEPKVQKSVEDEKQTDNLEQQLSDEKKQLSANAEVADTGEIDKYKQKIIQSISHCWLMPDLENKELACQLLVHVAPGGVVVSVEILKESGDPNLDRSARNAIMKASPLPVPESLDLFDNFRSLRLTFRPQGIISG